MAGALEAPQVLQAMARLLARAFGAHAVQDIGDAVIEHMQQALPPHAADPSGLMGTRRNVAAAARAVCLAGLAPPQAGQDEEEAPSAEAAREEFGQCIEEAAARLDKAGGPLDGRVLRGAIDALAQAARGIPLRAWGVEEQTIVREAETLGAPPMALFRLGGELLWANAALKQLCERSETSMPMVLQDAAPMVRRIAAASRALGGSAEAGLNVARLGESSAVHLRATLRASQSDTRAMLVEVVASQARRETRLTPRELQVATMIARHGSYRKAATESGISLDSVRTYVRRIYKKLAINSRAQLRARLIHEGLFAD